MTKLNQFLKFDPILKSKIWGGKKLTTLLHKKPDKKSIGESWEISGVEENISIVTSKNFKGKNLKELISYYKSELVGEKVYTQFGNNFPLLIKFIDAKEALSIQLHPNNSLSKKRHNSFGKTEMWYVMQADKNAHLIVGFKTGSSKEEYLYHLKNKTLTHILNIDKVSKGDVYFIPTGTVHAIGAGVLLAEIQQTSDITYRIYDWDRQNTDGTYRELHTKEALGAIDYSSKKSYKTDYKSVQNKPNEIISCPYFTTAILPISTDLAINNANKDSFVIYMCVKGETWFLTKEDKELLKVGETLLVPACLKNFTLQPKKPTELLEVYIK